MKPKIVEAWGLLLTRNGEGFDLQGDTFLPLDGQTEFPIATLPEAVQGKQIVGIGELDIGDEACCVFTLSDNTEHQFDASDDPVIHRRMLEALNDFLSSL
jgi:hypothetical protein